MNINEETLFYQALEKAKNEREKFLHEVCGENSQLRQRIFRLLDAHDNPAGLLPRDSAQQAVAIIPGIEDGTLDLANRETDVIDASSAHLRTMDHPGKLVGRYRLLKQIGGGGMGTVWMAEQQRPVRRKVALKLIKSGMDSSQVISRFGAERQALALMDHPNIARVLDAGTTDSGRPYFVMELVGGISITEYCDQQQLPTRQRLELFVSICQAIQHAHQKGIIHRDIKPSNVLVADYDQKPVPKVIDFGVAKAIGFGLTNDTFCTGFGGIVGTLQYMSPEQAEFNALDVDTRSDVYSLGVLLFELLTGTTPLTREQIKEKGITEALRLIREQDAPRPSCRLTESRQSIDEVASRRCTDSTKITNLLRGELDWIAMKALEKDRSRRYETANGLALDVQRYLNNENVRACPPSVRYRMKKFFHRYRYGVLTAASLLLVLMTGVVASTLFAVKAQKAEIRERDARMTAEQNLQLAREAVAIGFTKLSDSPELKAHGLEPLRKDLLENAKNFYAHFVSGHPSDPDVLAEQGQTCIQLAKIHAELGESVESARHTRLAMSVFTRLNQNYPDNAEYQHGLASALSLAGKCSLSSGCSDQCRAQLERAVQIRRDLIQRLPGREQVFRLASALIELGRFYHWESGQSEAAESTLLESLALCEQLAEDYPHIPEYRNELANALQTIGQIYVPRGDHELSLLYANRSLPYLQRLAEEHPAAPEYQSRLVRTLTAMQVAYHNLRQPQKALAVYRKARPIARKLAQTHPDVPEYQRLLSQLQVLYGGALSQMGEYSRAVEAVEVALKGEDCRDVLYNAACTYALAAVSVQQDQSLESEQQQRISDEYQQRAIDLLVQAERIGWFAGGSAIESLTNDQDFDILRQRKDFKTFLDRVKSKSSSSTTTTQQM